MKTSTLLIILAILGLMASMTSCSSNYKPIDRKDSIGYAVYDSKCLIHPEDNDPLYVPLDINGYYQLGDTVNVTEDGVLETDPIRDAETGQSDTHKVVITSEMLYTKYYAKGQ